MFLTQGEMYHLNTCQYSLIHHRIQNYTEYTVCCQRCNSSYLSFAWKWLNVIRTSQFFKIYHVKQYPQVSLLLTKPWGKIQKKRWHELIIVVWLYMLILYTCWLHNRVMGVNVHCFCIMLCESHWQLFSSHKKNKESKPGLSCQRSPSNHGTFIYY